MQKNKKVVYTCITGSYDYLIQHKYVNPEYDYICFTDNKKLLKEKQCGIWKIQKTQYKKLNQTKNARWHKTHPHIILSEYEESIWVDANINILTNHLFDTINENKNRSDILVPLHYIRNCIYDECEGVLELKNDSVFSVNKVRCFLKKNNMPRNYGLNETNIIWRKHHVKNIVKLMDDWFYHIKKYSKRDQLSFSYVLWKNDVKVEEIAIPNARINRSNYRIGGHTKVLKKANKKPFALDKIFSVKNRESNNHTWYKVIRILGLKFSFKNKALTQRKNLEAGYNFLSVEHDRLKKEHNILEEEYKNYKLEQAGLKKKKDGARGVVYKHPVDLQKEEPRTYFYHWIEAKSKVLDIGCACGDMGEILYKDKQCVITGLEYNDCSVEAALETGAYKNVIQCDLNKYEYIQINDKYDYIIMGDILEHLYNPQEVLKYFMQYLNDNGSVLISLPNVGHASIKANLLVNNFDYTSVGLLDNTHIRFFTYKTALELISNLGLCLDECRLTRFVGPLGFQKTNPYPELSEEIKKAILEDKNSSIVQFVFKCQKGDLENVAEKNYAVFCAELDKMEYMQDTEKYITKNS